MAYDFALCFVCLILSHVYLCVHDSFVFVFVIEEREKVIYSALWPRSLECGFVTVLADWLVFGCFEGTTQLAVSRFQLEYGLKILGKLIVNYDELGLQSESGKSYF